GLNSPGRRHERPGRTFATIARASEGLSRIASIACACATVMCFGLGMVPAPDAIVHTNHVRFNHDVLRRTTEVRMGEKSSTISVNCGGCITTIVLCVVAWALIFGVTVGGKHYGMSGCDTDHGVKVDK